MKPASRLLAAAGFPGFWKRSLDEFKRLSNIGRAILYQRLRQAILIGRYAAIKLEGLEKVKNVYPLWDFSAPESVEACMDMSDTDIGGFSRVKLEHVPKNALEPAHARFTGLISNELPHRENPIERTGYAAFRTRERPSTLFGRSLWDVEHYNFLALRVKSDGRKYKVNIQTESVEFTDLHQHRLYARMPGQWETILIKWSDFVRTNHGVIVEPQSEMLREKVRTIGIGLTDRIAGPFDFKISSIWATNGQAPGEIDEFGQKSEDHTQKEISNKPIEAVHI